MSGEVRLREATVGIVGLGLMGGSLGHALRGACARRLGADVRPAAAEAARDAGAVDQVASARECAASADLLVLAMPVRQMLAEAPVLAAHMRRGCVMTDLGSTKVQVCAMFDGIPEGLAAVGGHPMCGREQAGFEAADGELFRGAAWALVDTARTTPQATALVGELVEAVGARVVELDRHVHDRAVATASHAPFVVAQALVAALAAADRSTGGAARSLAATGFAGATRLAAGDVEMWRDILTTNSRNVGDSIRSVCVELERIAGALDEPDELERLLHAGRRSRHALLD